MNLSDAGLQFLMGWEGSRNFLYDDGGPGQGNATIGVGHLVHYGPIDGRAEEAPFVHGLSDAQVADLLRVDVQRFVDAVNRLLPGLSQARFDAMVDFAFNCGLGALEQAAALVDAGGDLPAFLRRFVHDGGGNILDALVRRREAEIVLWNAAEERMKYTDEKLDEIIANILGTLSTKADDQKVNDLANAIDVLPATKSGLRYLWALATKAWPFGT